MKATLASMVLALVAIVVLTFYLRGGSLPPHPASAPARPFALATDPSSDPLLIQTSLLHEPFQNPSSEERTVVSVSDTAYDAMTAKQRADFLRQIQRAVRDEVLASRQTEHPGCEAEVEEEDTASCPFSTKHGQEYQRLSEKGRMQQAEEQGVKGEKREPSYRCPKNPDGSCPPVPDMTQYIRKDQIPCWGCSVDY